MQDNFLKSSIIQKLTSLNLDPQSYIIFGSGSVYAHGLAKFSNNDLDLVVPPTLWNKLIQTYPITKTKFGDGKIYLFNQQIEIFPRWYPEIKTLKLRKKYPKPIWSTSHLIKTAEMINNLPFARPEYILSYKTRISRPKDKRHIKILQDYLKS